MAGGNILLGIQAHATARAAALTSAPDWLKGMRRRAEFLFWFADHLAIGSDLSVFLREVKSDTSSCIYAASMGLERSFYLHSRSLLENTLRHCYYDSNRAEFIHSGYNWSKAARVNGAELARRVFLLPHFSTTVSTIPDDGGENPGDSSAHETQEPSQLHLAALVHGLMRSASRFVHSSGPRERVLYRGIESISISDKAGVAVERHFADLYSTVVCILALYQLGEYMLISQPLRTYMLNFVHADTRDAFTITLNDLSLAWVRHQRAVALDGDRLRRRKLRRSPVGLEISKAGDARFVSPRRAFVR